jgi:phosphoglycolate phosphatase-like HAD superfamily hydrolase
MGNFIFIAKNKDPKKPAKVLVFDYDNTITVHHQYTTIGKDISLFPFWTEKGIKFVKENMQVEFDVEVLQRVTEDQKRCIDGNDIGERSITGPLFPKEGVNLGYFRADQNEITQMRRMDDLDGLDKYRDNGFVMHMIGGQKRLDLLKMYFQKFKQQNASLFVCTRGFIGPVKKALRKLDLLQYFDEVYGNMDQRELGWWKEEHAQDGRAKEDEEFRTPRDENGQSPLMDWKKKTEVLKILMDDQGLQYCEMVFVDDDKNNINLANEAKRCVTMWIKAAKGVTEDDLKKLDKLTRPESKWKVLFE